jgi:hypothetical protein
MTNQYFFERITGRSPDIRAADADREQTADRLREAHAEGRLDLAEFQERLEQCYAAKTFRELGALVSDLPRPVERRPDHRVALRAWRWALIPFLPILILLVAVSTAVGHHHHLVWLWLPLLFLFVWRLSSRRRRWSSGPRRGPGGWV